MKKAGKTAAIVLLAGFVYALVFVPAGLVIPCPYHLLTGRSCPGCGVTRMCMALLHGDWAGAYAVNRGLFAALPALALLLGTALYRYIRGEHAKKWTAGLEKWGSAALIVYLLLWGVIRNRYGI